MHSSPPITAIIGPPRTGKSAELARRLRLAANTIDPHDIAVVAHTQAEAESIRSLAGLPDAVAAMTLEDLAWPQNYAHHMFSIRPRYDQTLVGLILDFMPDATEAERFEVLSRIHHGSLWGYRPAEVPVPARFQALLDAYAAAYNPSMSDYGNRMIALLDGQHAPAVRDGLPLQALFVEDIQGFTPIERAVLAMWGRYVQLTWTRDTWSWREADMRVPATPHPRCAIAVDEQVIDMGDRPQFDDPELSNVLSTIYGEQVPLDYEGMRPTGRSVVVPEPPDADDLINQLRRVHEQGTPWSDIAIIVRHFAPCHDLFKALKQSDIPWVVPGWDRSSAWGDPDGYGAYVNPDVSDVHYHGGDLPVSVPSFELPSYVPGDDAVTVIPVRSTRNRTWPVVVLPLGHQGGWPLEVPVSMRPSGSATGCPAGMEIGLHCMRERNLFLHALTRHRERMIVLPQLERSPFLQGLLARLANREEQLRVEGTR